MSLHRPNARVRNLGFTLVEAIVVIVLTGILAGVVAVFLVVPVTGYLDVARRAELTDIADIALRRIGRDLRLALPNSIRVTAGNTAIEFIPVRSAGRYREAGPGDILDFSSSTDTSFDVIGPGVDVASGDQIVVYNLGITGSDAYAGTSRRAAAAAFGPALANVTFAPAGAAFPFASPARRFQVVSTPASYICAGGLLTRYSNYSYGAAPTTGTSGVLASNVATSGCRFTYEAGVTAQNGLVTLELAITKDDETVSLVQQVHVSNVP